MCLGAIATHRTSVAGRREQLACGPGAGRQRHWVCRRQTAVGVPPETGPQPVASRSPCSESRTRLPVAPSSVCHPAHRPPLACCRQPGRSMQGWPGRVTGFQCDRREGMGPSASPCPITAALVRIAWSPRPLVAHPDKTHPRIPYAVICPFGRFLFFSRRALGSGDACLPGHGKPPEAIKAIVRKEWTRYHRIAHVRHPSVIRQLEYFPWKT